MDAKEIAKWIREALVGQNLEMAGGYEAALPIIEAIVGEALDARDKAAYNRGVTVEKFRSKKAVARERSECAAMLDNHPSGCPLIKEYAEKIRSKGA